MNKGCHKCGELKLLSEYHKSSSSKDGYYHTCKTCRKELNQQNKAEMSDNLVCACANCNFSKSGSLPYKWVSNNQKITTKERVYKRIADCSQLLRVGIS